MSRSAEAKHRETGHFDMLIDLELSKPPMELSANPRFASRGSESCSYFGLFLCRASIQNVSFVRFAVLYYRHRAFLCNRRPLETRGRESGIALSIHRNVLIVGTV